MQEEVLAAAERVILLVVIIAIAIAIAILSRERFESLKGEAETVGASGFIVQLSGASMDCKPGEGWLVDFGQVNITDPQRRNLTIMPLLAFSGGAHFGFAKRQADMDAAPAIGGKTPGLIVLGSGGKGTVSSLQFAKGDFSQSDADPFKNENELTLMLGLWIWTGESGCVHQVVKEKFAVMNMADVLSSVAANCPDAYVGMLYRRVTNPHCS